MDIGAKDDARWTLGRVQKVIQEEFGITYHLKYLNRLLRSMGYLPPKAIEQGKALEWYEENWSRVESIRKLKGNP